MSMLVEGESGQAGTRNISGQRILVVEDGLLVAEDLADCLSDLGCIVVGPESWLDAAQKRAAEADLDGALLDINLHGEMSFPVAATLQARGVPFAFLSGYDVESAIPAEFGQVLRLAKPVSMQELAAAVNAWLRHPGRPD